VRGLTDVTAMTTTVRRFAATGVAIVLMSGLYLAATGFAVADPGHDDCRPDRQCTRTVTLTEISAKTRTAGKPSTTWVNTTDVTTVGGGVQTTTTTLPGDTVTETQTATDTSTETWTDTTTETWTETSTDSTTETVTETTTSTFTDCTPTTPPGVGAPIPVFACP
jgi:hypothetical protein